MKNLTKSALVLLTSSVLATSAFAASSDSVNIYTAKAGIQDVAQQLNSLGYSANTYVDLPDQKTLTLQGQAYLEKYNELKGQLDAAQLAN